ncbi:MAG TPA: DHH family phosphoesterase [Candidatus Saccharimonadales bacterium]|jgi:phosphoesterase RecJ-like protein
MTTDLYPEATQLQTIIDAAQHIVILQADNPDADSLGSALALEQILSDIGKNVDMYCGVDMPEYLRYLAGWDRVQREVPKQFDASIIVDAGTYTLFEKLSSQPIMLAAVKARPCVVLDHHTNVEQPIDFAQVTICDNQVASTGELIYRLADSYDWPLSGTACEALMASILGDTQGLMNELTKAGTYRVMADLVEHGANRPKLEEHRREYSKMPETIYRYKGRLLSRTEFISGGRIAHLTIPQDEINSFSPLYNPGPLVQFDMLQVQGVRLAIVFKTYDDGKVTAALRASTGYGVAGALATHMGGGGHPYASGFKVVDGRPFNEIKSECLTQAAILLDKIEQDATDHETLQHTYQTN